MRSAAKLIRSRSVAAMFAFRLFCLLPAAQFRLRIPTAANIRGLRPSGAVTMTQVFLSASGVGSGALTFRGRTYPFTLVGSLIGLGAISTLQASGEVYNLHDISQFSGPWIQGTGSLAITTKANGELWLENRNGVDHAARRRASGAHVQRRAVRDLYPAHAIAAGAKPGARVYPLPPRSMRRSTPSRRTK